ncbi:MAG: hypothetical protein AAF787_00045 [Chloroflexota bacterium]
MKTKPLRIIETLPLFATTKWVECSTRNITAIDLFARHYSSDERKRSLWLRHGFAGPGEKMTLITPNHDALFAWRLERHRQDELTGIECSVFRNESAERSSVLIQDAMLLARLRWGDVPMFTFVDARKVRSRNPGYCFKCAGWKHTGHTGKGLHVLQYVDRT